MNDAKAEVKPASRTGKLFKRDGKYYIKTASSLMFADNVVNSANNNSIAFIQSIRPITGSAQIYEVTLTTPSSSIPEDDKGIDIILRSFELDMSPNCTKFKNASTHEMIATFVQNDSDALQFYKLLTIGAKIQGQSVDLDTITPEDVEKWLISAMQAKQVTCIGQLVNGRCEETIKTVAQRAGQIPDFQTYEQNLTQFQADLEVVYKDSKSLTDYFIVTKVAYDQVMMKNNALWATKKQSDCMKTFLKTLHRNVFESYIQELNDMYQRPNITATQTAAVMWLLFYTQLPIFVLYLSGTILSRITAKNCTREIKVIVKDFHAKLKQHLVNFLPVRNETNKQILDDIRGCLEKTYVGVQEQMVNAVSRNRPDCL